MEELELEQDTASITDNIDDSTEEGIRKKRMD
jgi:hypothetical protein